MVTGTGTADDDMWGSIRSEAIEHLRTLVRINTSNPPGNELDAANYIKGVLEANGIRADVIESAPRRANLLAKLDGDGSKRPMLLLSHLDVVPADPTRWSIEPFSATIKDGYVWGRGTLDTKGLTVMELMAMVLAKRQNLRLKRDIKFAALADEECGGKLGAEWITQHHFDRVSAEFALNEGGHALRSDKGRIYMVATAEKGVCWSVLTARGRAGHGSMPHMDNAVIKIASAIDRLARHRSKVRITKTVARFIAAASSYDRRIAFLKLASVPILGELLIRKAQDRFIAAMLRNTFAPTMIHGGTKVNIIPDLCTLEVDSRILPGVTKEAWLREMKEILADLPIEVEQRTFNEATESDVDTEFYRVIERTIKEADPEATVAPFMVPGATDSRFLRLKGMVSYGLVPLAIPKEEMDAVHGVDERISVEGFELGLKITCEIVRQMCT
jgi:acetylornithine deacetylase/succinyl-diaminopimelate desuccinylase-like protein